MGSRRFRPMLATDLESLPQSCAQCTVAEVTRHWGHCGVVAMHEDLMIAHLSMAPAMYVPRLGAFATTPVSQDAAVIMSAYVAEEFRGKGIGRQLVQSAAGLLVRRDIRAMEAVGTYTDSPSCTLPTGWLEAVGFQIVRPHPITPRLRMDLQSTLRWRPDLGAAWHRLTGLVVSPGSAPEPASYAHREAAT